MKAYMQLIECVDRIEGVGKRMRRLFAFYRALEKYMAKTFPTEYWIIRNKHFEPKLMRKAKVEVTLKKGGKG